MILIFPALILILGAFSLVLIRYLQPRFSIYWIISIFSILLSYTIVLLIHGQLPISTAIGAVEHDALLNISPIFIADLISWPFALALISLLLASILTDTARSSGTGRQQSVWLDWAISMTYSAVGLLAVLAGNFLSILLSWTILDFLEFSVRIWKNSKNSGFFLTSFWIKDYILSKKRFNAYTGPFYRIFSVDGNLISFH